MVSQLIEAMKLSQKTIDEINRHTNPRNMLVVNVAGIRRLDTPIRVECIESAGPISKGMVMKVTAVKVTTTNKLLYFIHQSYYPYNCFEIVNQ